MADWRKIRPMVAREWLAFLPEDIYDLSDSSHVVRLMDALCGDSGVGYLRKRGILQRLQTSLHETRFGDLDELYSKALGLPRLKSEQYAMPDDGLVTWEQEEAMNLCDAAYRARIWAYVLSWQYGSTIRGLELAAQAGCGVPCQVIDLTKYNATRGIDGVDDNFVGAYWDSTESPSHVSGVYQNGYVIVMMDDGDISQEVSKSVFNVISRIHPQHVDVWLTNRRCVLETLGQHSKADVVVPCDVVGASSEWWNVKRTVTGRRDWDYESHPLSWVRPDVAVEAPRQALVYSQEERVDMTHLVRSTSASSEHEGVYGSAQTAIFPSLRNIPRDAVMRSSAAVSRTRSKWYSMGYVLDDSMVDWAYSLDLTGEMESMEQARYQRFWSSDEALSGGEWITFSLASQTPVNRLEFNLCRKPVSVIPWASQDVDAVWGDGSWSRMLDSDGHPVSFSVRQWGGSSVAGEMVSVSIPFSTTVVGAVTLAFERLDVPYLLDIGGAYERKTFPYSVDVANACLWLDVLSRDQFPDDGYSYRDPFGNLVESSIRVCSPDLINSGSGYWVSQPNVGEDAVEWVVFDVRDDGEPSRISHVDIECVYGGAHMVVYSSDDGESWVPYPGDFSLETGRIELEPRVTSFVMFELTSLAAIPYEVVADGIKVHTRRYPYDARKRASIVASTTRSLDRAQRLLTTPDESSAAWSDIYSQPQPTVELTNNFTSGGESLFWGEAYRNTNTTSVMSSLGYQNTAVERALVEPYALPIETSRYFPRFESGEPHEYDERDYERTMSIAYVVGISKVEFGRSDVVASFDGLEPFFVSLSGGANASYCDWDSYEHESRPRAGEVVSRFETVDLQTATTFSSIDFSVSQKGTRQEFEHPSDMSKEWGAAGSSEIEPSEFGLNGTTLLMTQGTGIESEVELVPAYSIAEASVQVFDDSGGRWTLEALDSFGENIFTVEYDIQSRRWTTVGTTFPVYPGNLWWDSNYAYRFRLDIDGPIVKGQSIFVPNVSLASLAALYGMSGEWDEKNPEPTDLSTVSDVRVIYYNGVSNVELPWDVTGDQEMWIRAQQDVPAGQSADGSRHTDIGEFIGAYYVYLCHSALDEHGQHSTRDVTGVTPPSHQWTDVFDENDAWGIEDVYADRQPDYDSDAASFDGDKLFAIDGFMPQFAASQGGFLDFRLTGFEASGLAGHDDYRYIFDYQGDDGLSVSLYFYKGQLTFKIVEPDGHVNSWVEEWSDGGNVIDSVVGGETHKMAVRWHARGTENVYIDGAIEPDDGSRRKIEVWLDSALVNLSPINNYYDEREYDEGQY